jgi:hypothetical protein
MMSKRVVSVAKWASPTLMALLVAISDAGGQVVPITVVTTPATSITATGATLNGTVDGNGHDISAVYFDYGTVVPYDHLSLNAVPFSVPMAQGLTPVSLVVGGLACGTTYHFRATADDENGRNAVGGDLTFTTAPCAGIASGVPVPTLSDWNLLALAVLVGALAWRRRRAPRGN